jgi:Uma2 family endonuclease
MATTTAPAAQPKHPTPHRFSVAEYEAVLERWPFVGHPSDHRFELVDGQIHDVPPMNDPHWYVLRALMRAFASVVASGRLLVQLPVVISDFDEPEPDVAIVRADWDGPGKPGGKDLELVVEVSDRTRRDYDLHTKLPRYQAAGVREVWIVDLVEQALSVWASPAPTPTTRYPRGRGGRRRRPSWPSRWTSMRSSPRLTPAPRPGSD